MLAGSALTIWHKPPDRLADVWRAYRHTARGYPPLWYGGGAASMRQESGRWHQEGKGVAQYLALSPHGAWAERCRWADIRDDTRRLQEERMLWELQVEEHDIADIRSFDHYLACDIPPDLAIGRHNLAWPLADELRAAGYRGILSPAAAFDYLGAINLTLFDERLEAPQDVAMPVPGTVPRPDLYIPSMLLTDRGAPTEFAMRHTCPHRAPHLHFALWCSSASYTPTII